MVRLELAAKSPEAMYPSLFPCGFTGDGNMDLVMGDVNNGTISIALGNGNGTFGSPTHVTISRRI